MKCYKVVKILKGRMFSIGNIDENIYLSIHKTKLSIQL